MSTPIKSSEEKPVLRGHSKGDPKYAFKTNDPLM